MPPSQIPTGYADALNFPLVAALLGRRARRFALGDRLPDGPLAFTSRHAPLPLSELEQLIVLTAAGGNTGWHYAITRNARSAPQVPNYAGAAGGRTFPSAAGFHTSELFFSDDTGVYFFPTRDAPALAERGDDGGLDLDALLEAHKGRIRKLRDGRLNLPAEEPSMEGHNTWCVNVPGSTLIIPVGDLAQHGRHALLPGPERLLHHRRHPRPAHPRHRRLPRAGGRGPPLPAELRGAVRPDRADGRVATPAP